MSAQWSKDKRSDSSQVMLRSLLATGSAPHLHNTLLPARNTGNAIAIAKTGLMQTPLFRVLKALSGQRSCRLATTTASSCGGIRCLCVGSSSMSHCHKQGRPQGAVHHHKRGRPGLCAPPQTGRARALSTTTTGQPGRCAPPQTGQARALCATTNRAGQDAVHHHIQGSRSWSDALKLTMTPRGSHG
jgi:hypothetical protein